MLEVKNLSAAYGQHPSLNDVSINVGSGEIVVILGANGAGKSTLIKMLMGTESPIRTKTMVLQIDMSLILILMDITMESIYFLFGMKNGLILI